MSDMNELALLSHAIEQAALDLAGDGIDPRLIAHELMSLASRQREAVGIALSYLLRHRERGTFDDDQALASAIDAVVLAIRRMA